MESTIEVEHAKIRKNQYGWVNFDSDGIICDRCQLKENTYGIYTDAAGTENPAAAMNHCRIEKNTDFDVVPGDRTQHPRASQDQVRHLLQPRRRCADRTIMLCPKNIL